MWYGLVGEFEKRTVRALRWMKQNIRCSDKGADIINMPRRIKVAPLQGSHRQRCEVFGGVDKLERCRFG